LVENCFSLVQHLVFSHVRLFLFFLISISTVYITIIGVVYLFVLHTGELFGGLATDRLRLFLETLILLIFRVTIFGFWLLWFDLGLYNKLNRGFFWFDWCSDGCSGGCGDGCYFRSRLGNRLSWLCLNDFWFLFNNLGCWLRSHFCLLSRSWSFNWLFGWFLNWLSFWLLFDLGLVLTWRIDLWKLVV